MPGLRKTRPRSRQTGFMAHEKSHRKVRFAGLNFRDESLAYGGSRTEQSIQSPSSTSGEPPPGADGEAQPGSHEASMSDPASIPIERQRLIDRGCAGRAGASMARPLRPIAVPHSHPRSLPGSGVLRVAHTSSNWARPTKSRKSRWQIDGFRRSAGELFDNFTPAAQLQKCGPRSGTPHGDPSTESRHHVTWPPHEPANSQAASADSSRLSLPSMPSLMRRASMTSIKTAFAR